LFSSCIAGIVAWIYRIDVIKLLHASRSRIEAGRTLAKQIADAAAHTEALILASQEAIFDCDQFMRRNPNYTSAYLSPEMPEAD
jgi:hypothetical protein